MAKILDYRLSVEPLVIVCNFALVSPAVRGAHNKRYRNLKLVGKLDYGLMKWTATSVGTLSCIAN